MEKELKEICENCEKIITSHKDMGGSGCCKRCFDIIKELAIQLKEFNLKRTEELQYGKRT